MDYKKEIVLLLEDLKDKGHDRASIEEKLGYAPNYIDQSLSRNGTEKLLKSIKLYNEWVLCNAIVAGKQKGASHMAPEIPVEYEKRFERLMAVAEQNTDTIHMISEAHLLMTKASLGVLAEVSSSSKGKEKSLKNPTEQMQGKSETRSGSSGRKQKDTLKN